MASDEFDAVPILKLENKFCLKTLAHSVNLDTVRLYCIVNKFIIIYVNV
jgi:hypothetical protein